MYNKGVVINLPGDIYSILNDERDKRKLATGKRPPLAAIVYEYFTIGLQSKLSGIVISPDNDGEQITNAPSAIYMQHSALELARKEKQIEDREQRLNSWENALKARDSDLRERELEVCEAYDDLCQKKIVFAEAKELSVEKLADNAIIKVTLNHVEKANQKLNEANTVLQDEINFLKKSVLNVLNSLCDQVDDLPQKDVWRDYVIPILPSVLILIQFVLTNKTMNTSEDIKKIMKEFTGGFNDLDEKKIAEILKMWQDMNGQKRKGRSP